MRHRSDGAGNHQYRRDRSVRRPEWDAGFEIQVEPDKITIGPGRYYVQGILCENKDSLDYDNQPYLIDSPTAQRQLRAVAETSIHFPLGFVLQVWQRMVTALDDPCLLEPALKQADTTTRMQTVWRVVGSIVKPPHPQAPSRPAIPSTSYPPAVKRCTTRIHREAHREDGRGPGASRKRLRLSPVAAAGYQGLENQLYRVEIHHVGDLTSATFKWSRENGSVVAAVTAVTDGSIPVITVSTLGLDANLGFQVGQWVELSDDTYQFGSTPNQSGQLFQIQSANPATLQVTMTTPVFGIDTTRNARMRRWDQSGASAGSFGIPVSSTPVPLENGIQVSFKAGQFQPGDYWTIPARTASGKIDWPPCGGDNNHFQRSVTCGSIGRRWPVLSCARHVTNHPVRKVNPFAVSDCRLLFPPLTAVNAPSAAALHVTAISWPNDDIMTVDTLLENGLSVTFDQLTTCPWGGGNFQVTFDAALRSGRRLDRFRGEGPRHPEAHVRRRRHRLLRPHRLRTRSPVRHYSHRQPGILAFTFKHRCRRKGESRKSLLQSTLNNMLSAQNFIGYGRVRVRLIGGAVYGSGTSGNIYLDGQSLGQTFNRTLDQSPAVAYNVPSGGSAAVSDYEGWFYLAPTLLITSVVIQGLEGEQFVTIPAINVFVDSNNNITGLQAGLTQSVRNLQASVTLSYPPVAAVIVTLVFTGPGAGTIVTIAASVTVSAGQASFTTPINVIANPGANVTDTVTLTASVPSVIGALPAAQQPTLAITGMAPPPHIIP